MRAFVLLLLPLGLAACQTMPADKASYATPAQGLLLAETNCSRCHAVKRTGKSANPDAPPFPEIANSGGMTQGSIAAWLKNSHNYPAQMGFTLEERQAEALAAYLIELRSEES